MGDKPENRSPPRSSSLHPAYTVTNIQQRIRVLDGVKLSYQSWVRLFRLHAEGFDVLNHIDGSPSPADPSPEYSAWKKLDAIVLQWIYGTLSDDLFDRVLTDRSTAREAWLRVENIFLNNKGSRAATLQHELSTITLAAMPSIEAYCQRIRELADQLTAVDCPVNNTQRVIYLARGLPREYDAIGSSLNRNLPPWETACDELQSEVRRLAARDSITQPPIVAAAVTNPTPNIDPRRDQQPRRPSGTRRENSRNNRPGNRSQNSQKSQSHAAPPYSQNPYPYWTPPPYWAPPCPYPTQGWAQPWPQFPRPNSRPSSSNTAPGTSQAQAHLAEVDPLQPTQLADAVQALSVDTGDMDDQWHFDTGASYHVTNDQGKLRLFLRIPQ